MKTVVFFEMALSVGKILAALLVILAVLLLPDPWVAAFIVSGLMTGLYILGRTRTD